jgi:hypothetical protein
VTIATHRHLARAPRGGLALLLAGTGGAGAAVALCAALLLGGRGGGPLSGIPIALFMVAAPVGALIGAVASILVARVVPAAILCHVAAVTIAFAAFVRWVTLGGPPPDRPADVRAPQPVGSSTVKVEPAPSALSTRTDPPCSSTICCTMKSPMPSPLTSFADTARSKRRNIRA